MLLFSFLFYLSPTLALQLADKVIYAVNCGGPRHDGAYGISYSADTNEVGVDSDYGQRYEFINAPEDDRALYQTERFALEDFAYEIPLEAKDGEYSLILKFSEVYFTSKGSKIFDVYVNDLPVIANLDILFSARGTGFAVDRYIPLTVQKKGRELLIGDRAVPFNKKIFILFAKGMADNPKVNAIALVKGPVTSLPPPPEPNQMIQTHVKKGFENQREGRRRESLMEDEEEDEEMDVVEHYEPEPPAQPKKTASGPRSKNPFDEKMCTEWRPTIVPQTPDEIMRILANLSENVAKHFAPQKKTDNTILYVVAAVLCVVPIIYYLSKF